MRFVGQTIPIRDLILMLDGGLTEDRKKLAFWLNSIPVQTVFITSAEDIDRVEQEYNLMGTILEKERRLLLEFTQGVLKEDTR